MKKKDSNADLFKAAVRDPNPQTLAAWKQELADDPDAWRGAGNLAHIARIELQRAMNMPPAFDAALDVAIPGIRDDLGYADANPLERLLIDQIALAWMVHYDVQCRYGRVMAARTSLDVAAWWEKRLSVTQARYLRAIEALARVRRLSARTPLQINIGGQQINVAGDGQAVNIPTGQAPAAQLAHDAPTVEAPPTRRQRSRAARRGDD